MTQTVGGTSAYRLTPTDHSPAGLERLAALFEKSFGNQTLDVDILRWQYSDNPHGAVVGFDAWSGDELAAHYATIPIAADLFGHRARGLLSVNTATHPNHQKRGLFSRLAEAAYARGAEQGFEFVIGAANDQSVHGFLKRLAFQPVARLETRLVASWRRHTKIRQASDFERHWTPEAAAWRLARPRLAADNYGHFPLTDDDVAVVGRSARLPVIIGALGQEALPPRAAARRAAARPRIWLGLDGRSDWGRSLSVKVPDRFRATSLTLIFRDLDGSRVLNPERTSFFAMDFDAY